MARHRPLIANDDGQGDRLAAVLGGQKFFEDAVIFSVHVSIIGLGGARRMAHSPVRS